MTARGSFSAALGIWSGREQEITRKNPRRGAISFRFIAVQSHAVPTGLRVHAPTEMRNRKGITIAVAGLAVLKPITHQFRIQAALDADDMPFANLKRDRIRHVSAIRQYDDVARREDDLTAGTALVRKCVSVSGTPMIEMSFFVSEPPLSHHRIVAAFVSEVGAGFACNANLFCALVNALGIPHRLFEALGR